MTMLPISMDDLKAAMQEQEPEEPDFPDLRDVVTVDVHTAAEEYAAAMRERDDLGDQVKALKDRMDANKKRMRMAIASLSNAAYAHATGETLAQRYDRQGDDDTPVNFADDIHGHNGTYL